MSDIQKANDNLNAAKARIQTGIEEGSRFMEDTQPLVDGLSRVETGINDIKRFIPLLATPPSELPRVISEGAVRAGMSKASYGHAIQFLGAAVGEGSWDPRLNSAREVTQQAADKMDTNLGYVAAGTKIQRIGQLLVELSELSQEALTELLQHRSGILEARDILAPVAVEAIDAYQDAAGWPKA